MKKNIKVSIFVISLVTLLFLGVLSTICVAYGNYNVALTKGTEAFTVAYYDETTWKNTVNSSTTPSNWFEGDSNQTGAVSKSTIKGWNYVTWETYDVLVSLFLPAFFESEEIIPLLGSMNNQGYNETTINANYTNNYNLWFGLRSTWNFTVGEFEEDPSDANDPLLIFQDPSDIDDILSDYNNISAEVNSKLPTDPLPILNSDEFLWQFIFNGLALGTPSGVYLENLITTLNCENATINGNILIINRVGETNYTVEITYGSEGIMSSFIVKDVSDNIIYQIISRNSEWVFYTILIVLAICIGGLSTYLILRKRKINRIRGKNK